MHQLFSYILKHYFFFLFILFELLSMSLIVQNNFQGAAFFNSTNRFTGSMFSTFDDIDTYFHLKKANTELVEENALLRNLLESSYIIEGPTYELYSKDSLYSYIGAKVISNSVNKRKNYLMLDKGSKHGIKKEMGVVSPTGVVGTVIGVSENYSTVMSVLHINNKVSARISKNRHIGSITWNGKNYREGLLTDIPTHVNLFKGDTIITSGNSYVFPEGIVIGTVNEYLSEPGDKFNTAITGFSVDYNNLFYVYVIINLKKEEQGQLDAIINNEE
ncbi:MAG: rod shape-determining protein MreC [Bacteroidetes bacterium]|nr:MAG: rod shape-determining protein MreC [Bacteroidota bacterium]